MFFITIGYPRFCVQQAALLLRLSPLFTTVKFFDRFVDVSLRQDIRPPFVLMRWYDIYTSNNHNMHRVSAGPTISFCHPFYLRNLDV